MPFVHTRGTNFLANTTLSSSLTSWNNLRLVSPFAFLTAVEKAVPNPMQRTSGVRPAKCMNYQYCRKAFTDFVLMLWQFLGQEYIVPFQNVRHTCTLPLLAFLCWSNKPATPGHHCPHTRQWLFYDHLRDLQHEVPSGCQPPSCVHQSESTGNTASFPSPVTTCPSLNPPARIIDFPCGSSSLECWIMYSDTKHARLALLPALLRNWQ